MSVDLATKQDLLRRRLRSLESAVVAFSGGVDSSLLAVLARQELGGRMVAVTALSPSLRSSDRALCPELAAIFSIPHEFVETDELSDPDYAANPDDRCYFCKRRLLARLVEFADRRGFRYVVEGTNASDLDGHRPGMRASEENPRAITPLVEAGISKGEVRLMARGLEIPTADRPSAACLASRIPTGVPITQEILERIDRAEEAVRAAGASQVRVRHHGDLARIEVEPAEMGLLAARRAEVVRKIRGLGWRFVVMDLTGYRTGGARG
ncbi:MAG: ATP-dependent sacrificial sulfur transferase LarE [Proteobacteria bacterium]|nr:ATP-dependent sacrificial sulfur transferase LarE [Pseudomonadota bacterium]